MSGIEITSESSEPLPPVPPPPVEPLLFPPLDEPVTVTVILYKYPPSSVVAVTRVVPALTALINPLSDTVAIDCDSTHHQIFWLVALLGTTEAIICRV